MMLSEPNRIETQLFAVGSLLDDRMETVGPVRTIGRS